MWTRFVSHTADLYPSNKTTFRWIKITAHEIIVKNASFMRIELHLFDAKTNNAIFRALNSINLLQEPDPNTGKKLLTEIDGDFEPEPGKHPVVQDYIRFNLQTFNGETVKSFFAALEKYSQAGFPLDEINLSIDRILGKQDSYANKSSFQFGVTVFKPALEGSSEGHAEQNAKTSSASRMVIK